MISQTGHEIDRYLLYALVSFGLAESVLKLILWKAAQGGFYAICTLSALILLLNDIGILKNSSNVKATQETKYTKRRKALVIIEGLVFLTLVILTISSGSRAALLSLFSGIFVIYTWIISQKKKRLIYYYGTTCLTFIVILLFLYSFRPASANGRILIWRVCIEMLHDKPLFGFGAGGFSKHYMNYQAEFLSANPGFRYAYLADDVFVLIMNYYISLSILGFLLL